jgi:hypothetical protein
MISLPCISVHQPWAWATAEGFKCIENRSWQAAHRGTLLIHAAKALTRSDYESRCSFMRELLPLGFAPRFEDLPRGGLVAAAKLAHIQPRRPQVSPWHIPGHYAWVLTNVVTLPFRKLTGQQRIFHVEVTDEEAQLLKQGGLL